jgi:hypothetical protein
MAEGETVTVTLADLDGVAEALVVRDAVEDDVVVPE